MTEVVATLTAVLRGETSDFERKLSSAGNSLKGFGKKLEATGDAAKKLTETGTRMMLPFAAAAAVGIKTTADFETVLSEVGARAGLTGKDLQKVGKFALEMGAKTMFSGKQAAEGMLQLLSSGQSVSDAMKTLPAVMDLAAAASLDLGFAADAVTDTMSMFSLGIGDTTRVADTLTRAAGASSATVEDLIAGFGNVGPIAKNFGMSIEQTAAALAVLSDNGIKGAEAGTALKSLLSHLSTSSSAAEALERLNVSLYDMEGKARPLPDVLGDLKNAMKDMTDEERNRLMYDLAGSYGQVGLAALFAGMPVDAMVAKMEKSASAAKIAGDKAATFAGKIDALKGSLESAAVEALLPFVDTLKPMVDELTASANSIGEWARQNPELANTLLRVGVALAVGMPALNFTVTTLGNLSALVVAGGQLLGGLGALAAALGPVGAGLAVIAGTGALAVLVLKDAQTILSKLSSSGYIAADAETRMKRYDNDTKNYAVAGRNRPGGLTDAQISDMISRGVDPQSLESFDPKLDMKGHAARWTGDTTPAGYGKAIALLTAEYSGAAEAERKRWQDWADHFKMTAPQLEFRRDIYAEERMPIDRQLKYNPNFASTSDKVRDAMMGVVGLAPEARSVIERGIPPASGWNNLLIKPDMAAIDRARVQIEIWVRSAAYAAAAGVSGASEGSGSGVSFGGVQAAPRRARGGPVTGGMPYYVGERGPELFVPGRSGFVVPNGGGGGVQINVTIQGESDPDVLFAKWQQAAKRANFRGSWT